MFCGRCCVTEPRSRAALRLDIFIEILARNTVSRHERVKPLDQVQLGGSFRQQGTKAQLSGFCSFKL
jgi:hypothetical protein